MHLLPQVKFPGDVGVGIIFIAGPAVELSLDDLIFNWQLSADWTHTHTNQSQISTRSFNVHRNPNLM